MNTYCPKCNQRHETSECSVGEIIQCKICGHTWNIQGYKDSIKINKSVDRHSNHTKSISVRPVKGDKKPAPVKLMIIFLLIAWFLFLVPVPLVGIFIGWPLNLTVFILSIITITRGHTDVGITVLVLSVILSPVIYLFGMMIISLFVGGTAVSVLHQSLQ